METPTVEVTPEFKRLQYKAARILEAIKEFRAGRSLDLVYLLWPNIILDDFQVDLLQSVADPTIREIYVKGNTGCGKGGSAGIAVCCYYVAWPDAKVIITRDSADTAKTVMFGEVKSWWRRMAFHPVKAVVQTEAIVDPDRPESHHVKISNPKSEEGFRGVHSPNVLHLYDEATADVLVDRYKLSDTQATKFIALANPSVISGPFRNAFPPDDPDKTQTIIGPRGRRRCITISGADCLNVREKRLKKPVAPVGGITIGGKSYKHGDIIPPEDHEKVKPIIPGQTCYDEYIGLCQHPDPDYVRVYAHGMFPKEDREKQVILGSWLSSPCDRHTRWLQLWNSVRGRRHIYEMLERILPVEAFGLDVADSFDGDSTSLTSGSDRGVRKIHKRKAADTMKTTGWVLTTIENEYGIDLKLGNHPIGIDYDGGYGAGVGDRLKEMGCRVIEIHGSASPEINPFRYGNKRAELYGEFGLRLDPKHLADEDTDRPTYIMPDDDLLRGDLCAPEKIFNSDGIKFKLTPKMPQKNVTGRMRVESIKEKLGRSPDDGDSVVYLHEACRYVGGSLSEWLDAGAF